MPRRSNAEILEAQDAVLAQIRLGAPTTREAARRAYEDHRNVDKWAERDTHGWKGKLAKAKGKAEVGWQHRASSVPDFITFRKEAFGHDTPAHHMEWVEALAPTGLPLFPGDDTSKWDRVIRYCRLLILQPPEHAKTTFAEELMVWLICLRRTLKSLFISKTEDVAKDRLYRIKSLLTDDAFYINEGLRNVVTEWGPFRPPASDIRQWAQNKIYVLGSSAQDRNATVEARGIGNQIQGHREDVEVLDDVFVPENQYSELERTKQLTWLGQTLLPRLPADGGLCLVIGTRAIEYDNYNVLLEGEVFTSIVQPAILDEGKKITLWPQWWPYEKLMKRKKEVVETTSERAWLLTYQQQATGLPDAPFSLESLNKAKAPDMSIGDRASHLVTVAGFDPALSGTAAIVVLGLDTRTRQRYVIDAQTFRGLRTNDDMKRVLIEACTKYNCREARVESNAMQGGFIRDLDLISALKSVGTRVAEEGSTDHNKFDEYLGVRMVAGMVDAGRYTFPWASGARPVMEPMLAEMAAWRAEKGWTKERRFRQTQDRVMALWLAELSCRRFELQGPTPKPDSRVPKHVLKRQLPPWVAQRRYQEVRVGRQAG